MAEIYLQIPSDTGCSFSTRRDGETGFPHNWTMISMHPNLDRWPKTVGDISSRHVNRVLESKWCGKDPVGVLVNGIFYDDDSFFYFSKMGISSNQRYRVVHKRPKWYDLKQYFKDFVLGVPYPSKFPKARKPPPEIVIHWIGIENWVGNDVNRQRDSPHPEQLSEGEVDRVADTEDEKPLSEGKKNCCGCGCVCKTPADH